MGVDRTACNHGRHPRTLRMQTAPVHTLPKVLCVITSWSVGVSRSLKQQRVFDVWRPNGVAAIRRCYN